jgi:hypothetical protein
VRHELTDTPVLLDISPFFDEVEMIGSVGVATSFT